MSRRKPYDGWAFQFHLDGGWEQTQAQYPHQSRVIKVHIQSRKPAAFGKAAYGEYVRVKLVKVEQQ